jgi:hypothetical protein
MRPPTAFCQADGPKLNLRLTPATARNYARQTGEQTPRLRHRPAGPYFHREPPTTVGGFRSTDSHTEGLTRVFCTACGTENPTGSRFCANCGAPMPEGAYPSSPDATSVISSVGGLSDPDSDFSAEAHQGAVDALTPGSALLVVKRGPNAGSRFLLDQDVTTAGRHPDSDIFLDDVTVSRRHAEFRREGSGYTVHDVGSLNGTYVNRERIDAVPLAGGDEVQIGKFRLVYLTAAVRAGLAAGA